MYVIAGRQMHYVSSLNRYPHIRACGFDSFSNVIAVVSFFICLIGKREILLSSIRVHRGSNRTLDETPPGAKPKNQMGQA